MTDLDPPLRSFGGGYQALYFRPVNSSWGNALESSILITSHLGFLVIGALIAGWTAWLFRTDAVREQTGRRLALLEEVALCKALRLYTQKAAGFRRQFLSVSLHDRDDDALRKALTEIQAIHEKLHGSLARRYNRKQG